MYQPAFPSANQVAVGDYMTSGHAGMTLRDYFAAAALQGLMSACDQAGTWTGTEAATGYAAKFAYDAADAMIAERSKRDA